MEWKKKALAAVFGDMAVGGPAHRTAMLTMLAAFCFCNDHRFLAAPFDRTHRAYKIVKNHDLLKTLIRMFEAIDDAIDNETPWRLAHVDASLDHDGISHFLKNEKYVPQGYLRTLKELENQGLMQYKTALAFSNLFAQMMVERAKTQLSNDMKINPNKRRIMARDNVDFSGIFTGFFFSIFAPNQILNDKASMNGLGIDDVRLAYPDAFKIGQLGQYLDDIKDMMPDLQDEIQNDRISPNIVLANAIREFRDYKRLRNFTDRMMVRPYIKPEQFSCAIRRGIRRSHVEFTDIAVGMDSKLSGKIMLQMWDHLMHGGLVTPAHPIHQERADSRNDTTKSYGILT